MSDLSYAGRAANHSLNFRQWNKSKLAQYFTPLQVSSSIFETLMTQINSKDLPHLNVLDPCAGNGRLLFPWKQAGAKVYGIELDVKAAAICKQNIQAESVFVGDILNYAPYLSEASFDIALLNPPYGLNWDTNGVDFPFRTNHFGGTIDSQCAVIEIATAALHHRGWMALIIPTSTFSNEKDNRLVSFLQEHFAWTVHATLPHLFKEEYGIDVSVDLLIGQKTFEQLTPVRFQTEEFSDLKSRLLSIFPNEPGAYYPSYDTIELPNLNQLRAYPRNQDCVITAKGVSGSVLTQILLALYDTTIHVFNPIWGKPSGIYQAWLSSPALTVLGLDPASQFLSGCGFNLELSENDKQRIERRRRKYQFESVPIHRPKSHQLLAYFDDRSYTARADVFDADNNLLFRKDKEYNLRPQWIRHSEVVRVEDKKDSKGKSYRQLTSLDRGYLSIAVETESGFHSFDEPFAEDIERLLKAFELPEVQDIETCYPKRVDRYRNILQTKLPQLFDYQTEDVARLCLKNFGYLGYEMGGGKTITALAYAIARGFKRVLIICQSSLIDNWINEADKFGIDILPLTTHHSIDLLRAKPRHQEIYITSYEFLSLDTARQYDAWECQRFDKDGNTIHHEICTGRHCSKGHHHKEAVVQCPKCGQVKGWTGDFCPACGYAAYSYQGMKQYPAYKRIRKAFTCIIVDEAQLAKNKSGRGEAVRALKSKARLLLSGTIMKGYVTDVYHNFRWLLGAGTALFPYPIHGGSKQFLDEFGTYEMSSREFEETLTSGRRKLIPEVSNLNRFWRLIASFTIRRTKDEMVLLPPKRRYIQILPMDAEHQHVYNVYQDFAEHLIERELRKDEREINMGLISAALWKLRFAASAPNDSGHLLPQEGKSGPTACLDRRDYNKTRAIMSLIQEIKSRGEKVIVFSGLRSLQNNIVKELQRSGIEYLFVPSETPTNKRFAAVEAFTANGHVALVTGLNVMNRGFTITAANNVILTDLEYSPEALQQAEDRAHRTGQDKAVNVYYLLSRGTIDEHIFEIINQKACAIEHAINGQAVYAGTAELLAQLDKRNVELAIAKNLLEKRNQSRIINPDTIGFVEIPAGPILPVHNPANHELPALSATDEFITPALIISPRRIKAHRLSNPRQLSLFIN